MAERDDHFRLYMERAAAPFQGDVYAVLDLSGQAAAAVRLIRTRFSYDYLGAMPVEITVTGSGGVGSPVDREDPRPFFAALDEIVSATAPIRGRLTTTLRFPDSDVFVAQPDDPSSIVALHEQITTCGIEFEPSPFPFVPHCTLTQPPNPTPTDLDGLEIDAEFAADTLSVYEMESVPLVRLRYRAYFHNST